MRQLSAYNSIREQQVYFYDANFHGDGRYQDLSIPATPTDFLNVGESWPMVPANSTATVSSPYPATVSFMSPSTSTYESTYQLTQAVDLPERGVGVFENPIPVHHPSSTTQHVDNDCTLRTSHPQSFLSPAPPLSRTIHLNPTILLSHQRASYLGPGTPLPVLSSPGYVDSREKSQDERIRKFPVSSGKNHGENERKIKRDHRKVPNDMRVWPPTNARKLAKIILYLQEQMQEKKEKRNNTRAVNNTKEEHNYTEIEIDNDFRCKYSDARDWLNEKAAKAESKNKTPRFIDRGTSPINFEEKQSRENTRDVALSPIRFIEPMKRCKSTVNDGLSGSKLCRNQPSVTEENSVKFETITSLEHSCERCEVPLNREEIPGCPTCRAQAALETFY